MTLWMICGGIVALGFTASALIRRAVKADNERTASDPGT